MTIEYGPYDTPMHSVAMIGVVQNERGQVLCIKRSDNGLWEPPAGIMELDETLEECVEREVLEETNVHVRAVQIVALQKEMTHPKRPVAVIYLCEYVSGTPGPSEETTEARWLSVDEVKKLVRPAHAARIEDAITWADRRSTPTRYHDGTTLFTSAR